jgi:hypothetical protein
MKKTALWRVTVTYQGLPGFGTKTDYDAKFEKIAKKHGGEELGSGYGSGGRDLDYGFPTKRRAQNFYDKVSKMRKVQTNWSGKE